MIYIERGPCPPGFTERAAAWTAHFQCEKAIHPDLTASKFWERIRPQLREDAQMLHRAFHGKCAFCESLIAHVAHPHVEHYRPKSKFESLVFEWENWLLSCGRCNDKKWAHFPECDDMPCLIDPTQEDPESHLGFVGYVAVSKTKRGEETIRLVGLDRSPLEDERSRWLMFIDSLLVMWVKVLDLRSEIRELLIWAMQNDAPYASMTRCYLRLRAPNLANPPRLHLRVSPENPVRRIRQLIAEWRAELQCLE